MPKREARNYLNFLPVSGTDTVRKAIVYALMMTRYCGCGPSWSPWTGAATISMDVSTALFSLVPFGVHNQTRLDEQRWNEWWNSMKVWPKVRISHGRRATSGGQKRTTRKNKIEKTSWANSL